MSEKASINISIFKKLVQHLGPYKGLFALTVTCTLLLSFLGPSRPILIGRMVNNYIVEDQNAEMLLFWTGIIVIMLIMEGMLQFASSYLSNLLAQSIINDIRQKLFGHIVRFRMQYFDKTPIGSLVTRVVSDLEAITEVFSTGLMDIAGDMLSLLAIVSIMFYLDWELALMTIIPIPLLLIATRIFARAMRDSYQQERVQVNRLNTFVQERISGMSIVQLFNRQEQEYKQFEEINRGHRQAHISAVWANSIFFPVVELLSSLSIALLLVYGALKSLGRTEQEIHSMYGEIIAFILYVQMLYRPIRMLADKFNILQRGTVRAERVFEILERVEDVQDTGDLERCDFNKALVFKDVSFAYQNEEWVLKNINLTIQPGEMLAFVGATGAGKSTIVNLIGRFYDFQKGDIKIGDTSIRDINLDVLRRNVAIVLQDVFLFSDTIHNNITLGNPAISREEVIAAAKAVGVDEFISKLPGNYDYQVGERGGVLSVGQRQLIAFVRASVYKPQILILDEATSSVDNESELLIQEATAKITEGRTSIVIAHRLSTIQKADKIVVLDKGKVIEMGTHSELLRMDGFYKKLYEKQFKDEIEEE